MFAFKTTPGFAIDFNPSKLAKLLINVLFLSVSKFLVFKSKTAIAGSITKSVSMNPLANSPWLPVCFPFASVCPARWLVYRQKGGMRRSKFDANSGGGVMGQLWVRAHSDCHKLLPVKIKPSSLIFSGF